MSTIAINDRAVVRPYVSNVTSPEQAVDVETSKAGTGAAAALEAQAEIARKRLVDLERCSQTVRQASDELVSSGGASSAFSGVLVALSGLDKAFAVAGQSSDVIDDRVNQLRGLPSDGGNAPLGDDWSSYDEFLKKLAEQLGFHDANTLAKYQDALRVFLEFYKAFTDIMEQIKPEASGDKGDVKIDFTKIVDPLIALHNAYKSEAGKQLATFGTKAEAEAFVKSLGLPGLEIMERNGKFEIRMDVTPVHEILQSIKREVLIWDSAKYNAWVSSRDSNMEQIKHVSKVLGEKLSEMTQKFDNFAKVLSASIDKLFEALKSFINGF